MGFIDYAWSVSLQKDDTKVRILQDPNLNQATLQSDNFGFTIKLPCVKTLEDGSFSFVGHRFPSDNNGKIYIGRLFRATVLHLTTHTLAPYGKEKTVPAPSDSFVQSFSKSLVNDAYVDAYLQTEYPNGLFDVAWANAVGFGKMKSAERIFTTSTRIMAAALTRFNMCVTKGSLSGDEDQTINQIYDILTVLKSRFLAYLAGEKLDLDELFDEKLKEIKGLLEPYGPFLEAPSFRHCESLGPCSVYSEIESPTQEELESLFAMSLTSIGGTVPTEEGFWRPEQEAEALQAFNSDQYQKLREEKILGKITPYVEATKFKGVSFPDEDYTQYLRARSLVQGSSRRLLEILRSAFNYLDEDPRQEMGALDLSAVIQSIAANKPATDVFVLDEYLKPSFAWSIILDTSKSMQVKGEYGRAVAIAVAEAAKELMQDATSWSFFGFSDRLYILKDSTESYSKRVRARIGGLKFDGLTFIPDAIHVAGKMLAKRFEEQRCLLVISDGWPYGYADMPQTLKECVNGLLAKGVIVIGIGVETSRMRNFFRNSATIFTQKDLTLKLGSLYAQASEKALET